MADDETLIPVVVPPDEDPQPVPGIRAEPGEKPDFPVIAVVQGNWR
jgi:hypothetical protein